MIFKIKVMNQSFTGRKHMAELRTRLVIENITGWNWACFSHSVHFTVPAYCTSVKESFCFFTVQKNALNCIWFRKAAHSQQQPDI